MDPQHEHNCKVLRDRFEGREAIYIEKGALRVRVTNIRMDGLSVGADVEEIITPGLGVGLFYREHPAVTPPYRWTIGGDSSAFSNQTWHTGYVGWIMYFDPKIIQAAIEFGARRSASGGGADSYNELIRLLEPLIYPELTRPS
jgi:CubicO group peptidase (beta-lactamase class C family)